MPNTPQLDNPKGAFGYTGSQTTGVHADGQGVYFPTLENVRNASTVQVIPQGAAVIWSTLSSLGNEVAITTVISSPLFAGVALTSAGLNTERTSVTTAAGLGGQGSDWCQIVRGGLIHGALLTSGVTAGDRVWTASSTVAGSTGGGYLTSTNALTTAAGQVGIAGIALSSGTTGTTGFLTTAGPRGIVRIDRSITNASTL